MIEQVLIFLTALIANTLSSLAGGGAGLLQLPALLFLGLPFATALATHKVASVALGLGASFRHLRAGKLNPTFTITLLAAGVPGVIVGALVILDINDRWAQLALGILTLGLGIYSFLKKSLGMNDNAKHRSGPGLALGGLVLFVIGFLNGSLTSGTGLFVTLWLVRYFGMDYRSAVAHTLVLVGLFWNGTGALTLALQTSVYWHWVPALLVASFLGGYLGARWSQIKSNVLIKRCFESVTILTGLSLVAKTLL